MDRIGCESDKKESTLKMSLKWAIIHQSFMKFWRQCFKPTGWTDLHVRIYWDTSILINKKIRDFQGSWEELGTAQGKWKDRCENVMSFLKMIHDNMCLFKYFY
jgi:hypothetical protein